MRRAVRALLLALVMPIVAGAGDTADLIEQLDLAAPPGLMVTRIQPRADGSTTVLGLADSNEQVAQFMRAVTAHGLGEADLAVVTLGPGERGRRRMRFEFRLRAPAR